MDITFEIFELTDSFDQGEIVEVDCRWGFRYDRFIPNKRTSTKSTSKGAYTLTANPPFVYAGGTFRFTMDTVPSFVAEIFNRLYMECTKFYFNGADGERFLVDINSLTIETNCGLRRIMGEFLIECAEEFPDFSINCP